MQSMGDLTQSFGKTSSAVSQSACCIYPSIAYYGLYQYVNSALWIYANMNPDSHDHIDDPETTLKGLIEQAGTNQRQLSRDSGVAEVTINSWVAGKYSPKLDSATLVAKALGVSLKSLAKSMRIDVTGLPDDYTLLDLKLIASELGIERIEDLPEDYRMLKRRRDLMRGQQN